MISASPSRAEIEGFGVEPRLSVRDARGKQLIDRSFAANEVADAGAALPKLADWLRQHLEGELPIAVGHRLVFGGTRYAAPVRIDDQVYAYLRSLVPLMPLHLPGELAPIEALRKRLPDIPQIGVFDTGSWIPSPSATPGGANGEAAKRGRRHR